MDPTTTTSALPSTLEDLFSSGKVVVLDGGTGEELIRQGCPDDRKIWSARAIKDPAYHDLLKQVHRSFLKAGASVVTTNSYGITQHVGFTPDEVINGCQVAARLAREAADEEVEAAGRKLFVLGSLGPLAESYRADLIISQEESIFQYSAMVKAMDDNVDAFVAETLSCYQESEYAVEALKQVAPLTPLLVSYTLRTDGNLRGGEYATSAMRRLMSVTSRLHVKLLAILFNCAEPEAITVALKSIQDDKDLSNDMKQRNVLMGASANRLTAVDPQWTLAESEEAQPIRKDLGPEHYHTFVSKWADMYGIKLAGGCCGITPEHIQYLSERL